MAQKTTVTTVSDLSGKGNAETMSFGLDGTTYEIDLTKGEDDTLRKALAEFLSAARRVSNRSSRRGAAKASKSNSGPSPADVRAWAASAGYEVPARGRIPAAIWDLYNADK